MSGVISQRCPSESFLLFLSAAGSEMGRAAGGGKFSWQDLTEHNVSVLLHLSSSVYLNVKRLLFMYRSN